MIQSVATVLIVLFSVVLFSHAMENQCPAGEASCPDDSTCCLLSNGSFGCCPIQNAVCCGDSVHCCPDGYTCDVIKGFCRMGRKSVPILKTIPAKPAKVVPTTKNRASDKASGGTTGTGGNQVVEYIKGLQTKEILRKTPALKTKISPSLYPNVICPDRRSKCEFDETCCRNIVGRFGCCPLPFATCCSDRIRCCPPGSVCSGTRCYFIASDDTVFPDKKYQCLQKSTCCKLPSGTYGCCPLERAVCCSDHKHCCPEGYTCDEEAGKFNKATEHINMIKNIPCSYQDFNRCRTQIHPLP